MSYPEIQALVDRLTEENIGRPNFQPALSREATIDALHAISGIYKSRPTDASVIYAYDALYRALGIDWSASDIVFLPRPH
ncbi:MAG: hypothetical protein V4574_00510 [Pseudomonadota bacterium]